MKVSEVLREAIHRLQEEGIAEPLPDASLLMAKALNTTRPRLLLHYEDPISETDLAIFHSLIERRVKREPVQYILERWGFMDFELEVGPGALVPRHETEDWLERLFAMVEKKLPSRFRAADIGTGTGAIGIAVGRRFPESTGILCDLSGEALLWAKKNTYQFPEVGTRYRLVKCNLLDCIRSSSIDLLVSNPPYIDKNEIPKLMPEVAEYEPKIALDGGPDGLAAFSKLLADAGRVLRTGGILAMEHGAGQRKRILGLPSPGLNLLEAGSDLSGNERYVVFEKIEDRR